MKKTYLIAFLLLTIFAIVPTRAVEAQPDSVVSLTNEEYVAPTFENFTKLYWALSKLDIDNNNHIDIFMRIHECEIYRDFIGNELAWDDVRESARAYLRENAHEFPIRFKIVLPIKLTEYDVTKQAFEISEKYQIIDQNMFLIEALERSGGYCGLSIADAERRGYPEGFIMMLPYELNVTGIPMTPEMATSYIQMKKPSGKNVSKNKILSARRAYIVMKVKIYSMRDDMIKGRTIRAYALAALEKVEYYADKRLSVKLYEEVIRERKAEESAEDIFLKRWAVMQAERDAEKARKKAEEEERKAKKAAKKAAKERAKQQR